MTRWSADDRAEHDVIVIGSGVAGLAAGVEAAETGADVLVLEAADRIGGASVLAGGGTCLVDTPLQRSQGISDSVELAMADWRAMGGASVDEEWARRYVADSATEVYRWSVDLGVSWETVARYEGNAVARSHLPRGWGRAVVDALHRRAVVLGCTVLTGTPAEGLDPGDGCSVAVRIGGSEPGVRSAGAVVVCTGGFVDRLDKVRDRAPLLRRIPRLLAGGSPTAGGTGHDLLASVGAQFTGMQDVWVYPTGTPDPDDPTGRRGLGMRPVEPEIWLNNEGRRFHDESLRGGRYGTPALVAQPGCTAWSIFPAARAHEVLLLCNESFGTPAGPSPEGIRRFWETSRHAWIGDDPRSLARAAGLPGRAVEAALWEFNDAVSAGLDTDPVTGRDLRGLTPLDGPLAAIQIFPLAHKNLGGVRTDLDCAVVRADGLPIPRLFAAGEVAGMAGGHINGAAALEGTMFGPCLYSGRIAGRSAARVAAAVTSPGGS
jgi:predicted oxidoreductase